MVLPLGRELTTFPGTVFAVWDHVIDAFVTGIASIAANLATPTLDAGFSDLFVIPLRRRGATTHGEVALVWGKGREEDEVEYTNDTDEKRSLSPGGRDVGCVYELMRTRLSMPQPKGRRC